MASMNVIKSMLNADLIDMDEYLIAEDHIAKKYCIKKGSIYRPNDLINKAKRGMYILPEKEASTDGKDNNEDRNVTQVRKED